MTKQKLKCGKCVSSGTSTCLPFAAVADDNLPSSQESKRKKKKQTQKIQSKEKLSHQIFFTLCKQRTGFSLSLVQVIPLEFSAAFSLAVSYRGGRKLQAQSQVKSRPFACLTSAAGIRFDVLHTPLWSLSLFFFYHTNNKIKEVRNEIMKDCMKQRLKAYLGFSIVYFPKDVGVFCNPLPLCYIFVLVP